MRDVTGPEALLASARSFEAGLRLTERTAALDELAELVSRDGDTASGQWQAQLDAERAIDLARLLELDAAARLARSVLTRTATGIAAARATDALGRALAWQGTEGATHTAERILLDAARRYEELGEPEWQGFVLFWLGNSVHLQNGALTLAEQYMRAALEVMPSDSPRRATVLTFLADVLITSGDWVGTERVLAEAARLAADCDDPMSRAYTAWSRARLASARGDAGMTERHLREAERDATDWFDINTGATFLADAAELLDRVGERDAADRYLQRATERAPADEFVRQARAALLARRGDPDEALDALQDLTRGSWLEKRQVWRHTMFAAYATLRAGRSGAGELAARALEQAVATGGVQVATSGEPDLTQALLPLAEAAGSAHARVLLAGGDGLVLRLFGGTRVARGNTVLTLPPGQAAELCRMLAVHPHGRPVEAVLDDFFGDVAPAAARHRLRQLLTRLRASAGEVVVREGDQVRLAPAWVDLTAFRTASDRALTARTGLAAELAHAALALWTGPPLATDPYAGWAALPREQLRRRYLALLDLVAAEARQRGSFDEALRALDQAREEDPYDESRYVLTAEVLVGTGRRGAAVQVARAAATALADIAVPLPPALAVLLR